MQIFLQYLIYIIKQKKPVWQQAFFVSKNFELRNSLLGAPFSGYGYFLARKFLELASSRSLVPGNGAPRRVSNLKIT
jgi:hypothetical protein